MPKSFRVPSAFALSLLAHAGLFFVLAFLPELGGAPPSPEETEETKETEPLTLAVLQESPVMPPLAESPKPEPQNLHQTDRSQWDAALPGRVDSLQQEGHEGKEAAAPVLSAQPMSGDAPAKPVEPAEPTEPETPNEEPASAAASGYKGAINAAIAASGWFNLSAAELKKLSFGAVDVEFYLDAKGEPFNIRVLFNATGNAENERLAIRAIRDARFPPMPKEMLDSLAQPQFKRMFTFRFMPTVSAPTAP